MEAKLQSVKDPIRNTQEVRFHSTSGDKKRSLKKWAMLFFVSIFVMIYMTYFWIFGLLRGKMLLGGKRK